MNLELTIKNYYVYNRPICIYKIPHHFAVILDLVITTALVQS